MKALTHSQARICSINRVKTVLHICFLLENCLQSQPPKPEAGNSHSSSAQNCREQETTEVGTENQEENAGDCVEDECNGRCMSPIPKCFF